MSKKNKKIKEQEFLAAEEREESFKNALQFSRQRFKRFDEIIHRLYLREDLSRYFNDQRVAKVNECFSNVSSEKKSAEREFMKKVFLYLCKQSVLFTAEDLIQSVANLLAFSSAWRQDIFDWKPIATKATDQACELIDHLFCHYPVPGFLYKPFFEKLNTTSIKWFIHIGAGKKVRDLENMPIVFTQKMGHYFLQAPCKFTVAEALRWAQVKGLGGDDKLSERIAYSWIGTKKYEDEDFWESFIRIVINGGMFNHEHLTQLIDYVRESKRNNSNYSLKGRTLQSLLRQSAEWHEQSLLIRGNRFWPLSGLYGYKAQNKLETIKMEELSGSKQLADEGKAMKHCVASYVYQCEKGQTAIFSLRKYSLDFIVETMATIEVNLSLKRVAQAKAKMNRKISDEARKHLEEWASKNNLSISPFL
ncbi:MAG: PcfJ domain-containing protein [Chitinophagaceae bacterium]